jgi:hypothetical protein
LRRAGLTATAAKGLREIAGDWPGGDPAISGDLRLRNGSWAHLSNQDELHASGIQIPEGTG